MKRGKPLIIETTNLTSQILEIVTRDPDSGIRLERDSSPTVSTKEPLEFKEKEIVPTIIEKEKELNEPLTPIALHEKFFAEAREARAESISKILEIDSPYTELIHKFFINSDINTLTPKVIKDYSIYLNKVISNDKTGILATIMKASFLDGKTIFIPNKITFIGKNTVEGGGYKNNTHDIDIHFLRGVLPEPPGSIKYILQDVNTILHETAHKLADYLFFNRVKPYYLHNTQTAKNLEDIVSSLKIDEHSKHHPLFTSYPLERYHSEVWAYLIGDSIVSNRDGCKPFAQHKILAQWMEKNMLPTLKLFEDGFDIFGSNIMDQYWGIRLNIAIGFKDFSFSEDYDPFKGWINIIAKQHLIPIITTHLSKSLESEETADIGDEDYNSIILDYLGFGNNSDKISVIEEDSTVEKSVFLLNSTTIDIPTTELTGGISDSDIEL